MKSFLNFLYNCSVKLFPKIRLKLGQRSLRKKAALIKRKKTVHNFNTAKSVGIIFDASISDNFDQVKEFRKYLSSRNIHSDIMAYLNADDIPGEFILRENCFFYGNKDLDYFYQPANPQINNFIEKKFDILFDLSLDPPFPLLYISTLSMASFKVGKFSETPNDYDLMINTGTHSTIEYLVEQIKHYVGNLNNQFIKSN